MIFTSFLYKKKTIDARVIVFQAIERKMDLISQEREHFLSRLIFVLGFDNILTADICPLVCSVWWEAVSTCLHIDVKKTIETLCRGKYCTILIPPQNGILVGCTVFSMSEILKFRHSVHI